MATIAMLEAAGSLLPYEPDFEHDEFPTRWIHQAPDFPAYLERLQGELPDRSRNLSPFEQVEQLLFDYSLGRPMVYARDRRLLDPVRQHVWEMKTLDVRLFGWLPMRRHIILVCGELKRNLRDREDYDPFIARVIQFRDNLNLDPPKALSGLLPNEIC